MSAAKLAIVIAALVLAFAYQSARSAEPPPDQVHDAASAAVLIPDQWPHCVWVEPRICVTPAEFERMTGRPVEPTR